MKTLDDTFAAIRQIDSRAALWNLALDYFNNHGIDKVSYHAAAVGAHEAEIVTDGFPEGWVDHYIGKELIKIDPIPELAAISSEPFLWSDARKLSRMSRNNLAYLDELRDSGLGEGLAFCVFGPMMRNAYVGLGFREPLFRPDSAQVAEYQMVAQMAHLRYCELTDGKRSVRQPLSMRERQVLIWVARGKSNGVIADILDLSPHTVDTIIRRTYQKLGVTDRTTAAIRALGKGLIQYHEVDVA
ncbi:MAG: LuxR family transcriptional regulator [Sulfitobacter sp.]|nr:LuxR family transcriptional regulator [Sulfitobacter sp.]